MADDVDWNERERLSNELLEAARRLLAHSGAKMIEVQTPDDDLSVFVGGPRVELQKFVAKPRPWERPLAWITSQNP